MNQLRVRYEEDSSVCNRRAEYFKSQLKQKNSIADIKLYGLKEYFLSKYEKAWQELYQKKHSLLIISNRLSGVVVADRIFMVRENVLLKKGLTPN